LAGRWECRSYIHKRFSLEPWLNRVEGIVASAWRTNRPLADT
jgi:hypothetical protein